MRRDQRRIYGDKETDRMRDWENERQTEAVNRDQGVI